MASFRDIWNLVVQGDTRDVEAKLGKLAKTAEATGATADTSIRGRMGGALTNVAQKIPGVSGLMDKFGVSSSQAGALMGTAVAGGALAAGTAVAQFVQTSIGEFQQQAQEVLHFRDVSGLAADEASRFVAVADDFGVSGEGLATAIGKMDKAADVKDKLKDLGIEIGHNKDGAYDAQQTFLNVVDAFNNTDDASRKAAIGSGVFGKGWQDMSLLLEQGSGKIKDSFAEVKDFQMFSDADLAQSEDYRLKMDDLNDAIKGFERELGQAAIPVVAEFTQQLTEMAAAADSFPGGLGLLMQTLATVVFPGYESSGGGVADVSRAMVEEAKKNVDQMEAIALATPKATGMVDAYRAALDLTVGSGAVYAEANSARRKALDDEREALKKTTQALKDYRDMTHLVINDELGVEGAFNTSRDAIESYNEKLKDHTTTYKEHRDALLSVKQSFESVRTSALDFALNQAALHGATLDATQQVEAQVLSLRHLYDTMAPGSPLRAALDQYILQLFNIPGQIVTNVDLEGNGVDVLGHSVIGTRREGSGAGGYSSPAAVVGAIKSYESSNGTGWRTGPQ